MESHAVYTDGQLLRMSLGLIKIKEGFNPRRFRTEKKFKELCDSVAKHGVEQSIVVRPCTPTSNEVYVVAGEGRYLAAQKCGLIDIPVHVMLATEEQALFVALRENGDREDMSIPDEAISAQRAVSICSGDREAAGSLLGWSKRKIDSRLLLCNCSEEVLDAVNANSINVGHAELLSQLTQEMQNATLTKCIDEGWTVRDLKERAVKVAQDINAAIFDKEGCNNCHHNSSIQHSLFANSLNEALCANFECYQEKTKQALEQKKLALEETYVSVFLDIEKPPAHRRDISEEIVGEAQHGECKKCTNLGCVVHTDAQRIGQHTENQCFDLECYDKVVSLNKEMNATAELAKTGGLENKGGEKLPAPKPKKNKSSALPNSVIENYNGYIRHISSEMLLHDNHAALAMITATVVKFVIANECTAIKEKGIDKSGGFDAVFKELLKLEMNDLSYLARDVVCSAVKDGSIISNTAACMERIAATFLTKKAPEKYEEVLKDKWKPDESLLNGMTIPMILDFLEKSGYGAWLDAQKEGAFLAFKKKKKKEIVKAVLETEYAFKDYCPEEILKIVKKNSAGRK